MSRTIEDALLSRRSCRAFLPTPVPRATIERLLALAASAGSNANCQPWQVHVLGGPAKQALTDDLLATYDATGPTTDVREYDYQPSPDEWPEPFRSRRRGFGAGLYRDTLGIAAEDAAGRRAHHRRNYDFFGAPVGLIITVSRGPMQSALIDAGLFLQSLMLAARALGLHTCAQACFIDFAPVLRRHLSIAEDHVIVCGMAVGHADDTHPLDEHRTTREPVAAFATFYSS
ncbi:MAG TPA: nitroreductase [Pseudonocardiaceae bacterium]|jgi:nitroreductase|nr:nitroreductase [Pseudonocardiaceae bacterium]